jgi:hypothetical protein
VGGGSGDKKSWLEREGGHEGTFLVEIRRNKNIVTQSLNKVGKKKGGCKPYEYRWEKKKKNRLSDS